MYSKLQLLPVVGALVIIYLLARSDTLDTQFGLPMIYPYGNCSAVQSPQTLTAYYSNSLNYSSDLIGFIIGGSAPILLIGPRPINNPAVLNLITQNPEASEFYHCLHYYCDQTPDMQVIQESNKICTESDSITAITSFITEDPTVTSLVSHKIEERVYVYSPTPVTGDATAQDNLMYEYTVLHGKTRSGAVPAVAITIPITSECANITITPNRDVVVYRARHRDEFVNLTLANRTTEVSCLMQFEVVWIEPTIRNCNIDKQNLQGTVIKSSTDLAIFNAEAECNVTNNNRGFGYVGNLIHALPPVKRWGTTFITDLTHLQYQLPLKRPEALFHIIAEQNKEATIVVTRYTPGRRAPAQSSKYRLESNYPLTIQLDQDAHTHIIIESTSPVLVVYDVCCKVNDEPYFSSLLQPVEWFTQQQSLLLSHSLVPQVEKYYVILVIKSSSDDFDITNIQIQNGSRDQSTPIMDYKSLHSGNIHSYPVGTTEYMIVLVTVDSEQWQSNDTHIIVKSVDGCTNLGASVIYYGEQSSYAHTNTYVLDENPLIDAVQCTVQTTLSPQNNDRMYAIISTVIGSLLLATISIITSITFYIRLTSARLPPGPPHQDFEHDIFLSFADEDRTFATKSIRDPLRKKGYSVFWHYSDFIAGITIDENIIRATKLCRRVIFVCSEHFCKSEFCQKELKYALHSHYSEYSGRYRRVIPLVVQEQECPKELQQLHPILVTGTSENNKDKGQKLIKRLNLGKPIKNCKSLNKNGSNQVVLHLERLPPSEMTE